MQVRTHGSRWNIFRLVIPALILLAVLNSCSTIEGVLNLSRPSAEFEKVEISGLNFDRVDLVFFITVHNPNSLDLKLAGLEYDLLMDDNSVVSGNMEKGMNLKAGESSLLEVPVSLAYSNIFKTVQSAREKDELDYEVNLGIIFTIPGYSGLKVPLSFGGTIPVPKLPSLELASLQIKNISLTRIDMELRLEVFNPNNFSIDLNNFNYDLAVGGRSWVQGKAVRPLSFQEKSTSTAGIPLSLNIVEVGRSILDLLSENRSLDYKFSGDTLIDTGLPMLQDYLFSFSKDGQATVFR